MTIPKIILSFKSWASFYFIPSLQLVDIHSTIIIYMINASLFMTEDNFSCNQSSCKMKPVHQPWHSTAVIRAICDCYDRHNPAWPVFRCFIPSALRSFVVVLCSPWPFFGLIKAMLGSPHLCWYSWFWHSALGGASVWCAVLMDALVGVNVYSLGTRSML